MKMERSVRKTLFGEQQESVNQLESRKEIWRDRPSIPPSHDTIDIAIRPAESAVYETTDYSPSQMLFGRDIRLPADLLFSRPTGAPLAPEEYIEKLQARMEEMHHLARERIDMVSEKIQTRYDARATGHYFTKATKCGYGIRNVANDSL
ncbi:retrovirus-related Pol polyprotein from transposon 412 [Trichonephila clavipes]|nr:retrovirus-related Pol polyprotein from transposon 412 [Trichonephila clavipes]